MSNSSITTLSFASLDPRPIEAAQEANAKIFEGGNVLGIEVTHPKLAQQCQLGNIDPQHGPGGSPTTSAIEAALTAALPPVGAVLATIRPDSDSVGAMAILSLRMQGKGEAIDTGLVAAIGRMDGLGPQARDLPEVVAAGHKLAAANFVCLGRRHSLEEKVQWMADLLVGEVTEGVTLVFAEEFRAELEKAKASLQVSLLPGGRVAVVQGNSPRGFEVGYATGASAVICFAPNFLRPGAAEGEQPVQKWTIARYSGASELDVTGLKVRLAELEDGWGGPADLVASPQGVTSAISAEKIIGAVLASMTD